LALLFVALAAVVGAGWLQWLDAFGARYLMPGLPVHFGGVPHPFHAELVYWTAVVVSSPAGSIPAFVLAAGAGAVLWRRGRSSSAAWGIGALVAISVVELVCRHVVTRSAIEAPVPGGAVRDYGVHASFPSGHAARAVVLGALAEAVLRRRDRRVVWWIVAVALLQELAAFHAPTDVLGALLLGGALVHVHFGIRRPPKLMHARRWRRWRQRDAE
jgi:membrane-associated phospholipid phosphatase